MRYLLILLTLVLFSIPSYSQMLDVDYEFIDTAFDGIKPVTNKEFDDTINKLTPQPVDNSFKGKLKAFFFGRKYGVDPSPKGQDKEIDIGGELKAIQDIKNGVYYIKLLVSIYDVNRNIIPLGNYKISEKTENDANFLVFYQGNREYGKLKLKKFEDSLKKEHDITYSRVDILDENVVRVVYSTLSDTKCAYAQVYLQN